MLLHFLLQIPDLKLSHVHIQDWNTVAEKVKTLIAGNHEKLQVGL